MKHNTITKRLLALLQANPMGVTSAEAAKLLGVTSKSLCRSANEMRDQRQVVTFRLRFTNLIVVAEHAEAARVHLRDEQHRNLERKRAERDAARSKQRRAWDRHEAWGDREPVQRVIAASNARPLGKVGPSSVFEVAA